MDGQKSCQACAFRPRWWATASTILALVVLLASVQPVQARRCNLKISGEMPEDWDVSGYEVSPDGLSVVYTAEQWWGEGLAHQGLPVILWSS